jgi:hypothetical protein
MFKPRSLLSVFCVFLVVTLIAGLAPRAEATSWTPAYLPATTNALWLDAADSSTVLRDGTAVTNWLDKSGNNRSFTNGSSAPTYATSGLNGLSVINFAGQYLNSIQPSNTWKFMHDSTKYAVFLVVKPGITANPIAPFAIMGNAVATSTDNGFYLAYDNRQGTNGRTNRCSYAVMAAPGSSTPVVSTLLNSSDYFWLPNEYQVFTGEFDPGNATASERSAMRRNGDTALKNNTATLAPASTKDPRYNLQIGAYGQNGGALTGGVAEVLITSNAVSTALREKIEGYLAWKWGLQGNLPGAHTYYTAAPTVGTIAIGLVNGGGSNTTLNATLTGSNSTWNVYAYWGPTDGTNTPSAWTNNALVGTYTVSGIASTNIAYAAPYGLVRGGTNYYTFYAVNSATNLWATPSTNFVASFVSGTIYKLR